MFITNLPPQDYWFDPLHLAAGNGQTLTLDDTSATSLYLTDDRCGHQPLENSGSAGGRMTSLGGGSGVSTGSIDAPAYLVVNYIIRT